MPNLFRNDEQLAKQSFVIVVVTYSISGGDMCQNNI